ncbi:MAG: hypothetical protein WBM07_04550 [Chitinivibrionales bacterium]
MSSPVHQSIDSTANLCPITTLYRSWFFNPPSGTIAGYPQKGTTAEQDARIRISGYSRMFVKGKLRYYSDGTYDDKQDSISFYYNDSDTEITKRYSIVDSFFICCPAFICLLSENPKNTIDITNASACKSSLREQSNDEALLYGKGTVKMSFYAQASSWMMAEEQAVKALCRQSAFYYASLVKMNDNGHTTDISKVMRYEMDLEVRNLTVVSRAYEVKDNYCTVWVACKKSDISPWKDTKNE